MELIIQTNQYRAISFQIKTFPQVIRSNNTNSKKENQNASEWIF